MLSFVLSGNISEAKEQLQATKEDLSNTQQQLGATTKQLLDKEQELHATKGKLHNTTDELQSTRHKLQGTATELDTAQQLLRGTSQELNTTKTKLEDTRYGCCYACYVADTPAQASTQNGLWGMELIYLTSWTSLGVLPGQIPTSSVPLQTHAACRGELGLTKSQMEMMKRELNSAKT